MNDIKLGTLANKYSRKDAIHIAIAPVEAGQQLRPGEPIALRNGKAYVTITKAIGIVDPFLHTKVNIGEMFYLLLYQNTVTGMRHDWSHPMFIDTVTKDISASEQWIREYAARIRIPYDELMQEADSHVKDESGTICFDTTDYPELADTFWIHYKLITGKDGKGSFFRCAC